MSYAHIISTSPSIPLVPKKMSLRTLLLLLCKLLLLILVISVCHVCGNTKFEISHQQRAKSSKHPHFHGLGLRLPYKRVKIKKIKKQPVILTTTKPVSKRKHQLRHKSKQVLGTVTGSVQGSVQTNVNADVSTGFLGTGLLQTMFQIVTSFFASSQFAFMVELMAVAMVMVVIFASLLIGVQVIFSALITITSMAVTGIGGVVKLVHSLSTFKHEHGHGEDHGHFGHYEHLGHYRRYAIGA